MNSENFEPSQDPMIGTSVSVIENRSLGESNSYLVNLLRPGMKVLDIGCGTGAITSGIAQAVFPNGKVVGIDSNAAFMEKARIKYQDVPNLSFEVGDIFDLPFKEGFDLVNASRILQWLPNPEVAVQNLIKTLKIGGKLVVLDYNHEKYEVKPQQPESMGNFLRAYLEWRTKAGMDMEIADHLAELFQANGLTQIQVTPQHEITRKGEPGFESKIQIRAEVVANWGRVMVSQGVITEEERAKAETDYLDWIDREAKSQFLYLLAVEGVRTE